MKKIIIFLSIIFAALLYIEYQTEVLKEADNLDSVEFVITQEQESVDFNISTIAENIIAEFSELRTARDNTAVVIVYDMMVNNFLNFNPGNNKEGVPIHNTFYTTTNKNKDVVYITDNYNLLEHSIDNTVNTTVSLLLVYNSLAIIGCMPRGPTNSMSVNNYS